ncbi:phenoloxidase-activating factor 2-like [Cylas formicarius]|uniref:phenoloxidase-activating factor 2-like n=1 Tax=Cylas formicarius TaxID=197179 RepID=UPI0029585741|nr:phenoloxidase-activating factor 2-like [Cylas formicarius]
MLNTKMTMSIIGVVLALLASTAKTQRTFSCVLPSLCKDGGTIDPRILIPGTSNPVVNIVVPTTSGNLESCPAGYIQCTNVACGTPSVQPATTDGFATQNAFPWQVFLRNNLNLGVKNGYVGGGALLSQYYVLTAAHKITNLTSVSVILGAYSTSNLAGTQTSQVSGAWIHSNYNQQTLKNDIAVLQLATPMNIGGNTGIVCLPPAGQSFIGYSSASCIVSGWGQTNFSTDDAPTQTLKQVHVPIVTNEQCRTSYLNPSLLGNNADLYLDFPNEICAGGGANQDACTQDGGSPLVCKNANTNDFSLVGLVIWGKNCGLAGVYGVYVSVPAYLTWIQCAMACSRGTTTCSTCPATRFL